MCLLSKQHSGNWILLLENRSCKFIRQTEQNGLRSPRKRGAPFLGRTRPGGKELALLTRATHDYCVCVYVLLCLLLSLLGGCIIGKGVYRSPFKIALWWIFRETTADLTMRLQAIAGHLVFWRDPHILQVKYVEWNLQSHIVQNTVEHILADFFYWFIYTAVLCINWHLSTFEFSSAYTFRKKTHEFLFVPSTHNYLTKPTGLFTDNLAVVADTKFYLFWYKTLIARFNYDFNIFEFCRIFIS